MAGRLPRQPPPVSPDPARHPRHPAAAHGAHHRAPPEHGGAGAPHRGAGQGPRGAAGHPPAAAGPGRPLRQAGAAADAGARARPGLLGRPQRARRRPQGLTVRPACPVGQRPRAHLSDVPTEGGPRGPGPRPRRAAGHAPCHCFLLLVLVPVVPATASPRRPAAPSRPGGAAAAGSLHTRISPGMSLPGWMGPGQLPGFKNSLSLGVVVGKVTEMF